MLLIELYQKYGSWSSFLQSRAQKFTNYLLQFTTLCLFYPKLYDFLFLLNVKRIEDWLSSNIWLFTVSIIVVRKIRSEFIIANVSDLSNLTECTILIENGAYIINDNELFVCYLFVQTLLLICLYKRWCWRRFLNKFYLSKHWNKMFLQSNCSTDW